MCKEYYDQEVASNNKKTSQYSDINKLWHHITTDSSSFHLSYFNQFDRLSFQCHLAITKCFSSSKCLSSKAVALEHRWQNWSKLSKNVMKQPAIK